MAFSYQKSVAVFAAREDPITLTTTLNSIISDISKYLPDEKIMLDVLINGNKPLAEILGGSLSEVSKNLGPKTTLRIWFIPFGDKAHAWNEYLHTIWNGSDQVYFVDGYAHIKEGSLAEIAQHLENSPEAIAATGIPSSGASANSLRTEMLSKGGFHGSLHAIRGGAMNELRERGFRLPIGLYRTDSLIGAVIAFGLDPVNGSWAPGRTVVVPGATWTFKTNSLWTAKDLVRHWKRMVRQARGVLENIAVRQHMAVEKKSPETLPAIADDLIRLWIRAFPISAAKVFLTNPLSMIAAKRAFVPKDWSESEMPPSIVATGNSVASPDQ